MNDCSKRKIYGENTQINCDINIFYVDDNEEIVDRITVNQIIDYEYCEKIIVNIPNNPTDRAIIEIYFDDVMMYKNIIIMKNDYLF